MFSKSKTRTKERKYTHDYYTVEIPLDFGSKKKRLEQAIVEAKERTRLYCIPAVWEAVELSPGVYRVRRLRLKRGV